MAVCSVGWERKADNPKVIIPAMSSSVRACPVDTRGPVIQPRRGDWEMSAVVTGPGESTAPIAMLKAKKKMAGMEFVGNIMPHIVA